jgi:hypothetical protein
MRVMRTRMFQVAVAVAATGAMVLWSGTSASANSGDNRRGNDKPPVISITATDAGGFTLPSHVQAGLVTFKIGSTESTYHGIQGFRPQHGHTAAEVVHDLELGVGSSDPADHAAGAKALQTDAVLIGGAVTSSVAPISVTVPLETGTYYFFDLNDFFLGITPRLHTLKATGRFHWSEIPRFSAVITATMKGAQPGFNAPTDLSAKGTFLIRVTGDEVHEAVFRQTRPGITDAYVTQFYDAVVAGTPRPQSPWLDAQHGLQAMSPGRWAVVHVEFPPGDYSLICYVPSDEDGMPHAYMGMHQEVHLH